MPMGTGEEAASVKAYESKPTNAPAEKVFEDEKWIDQIQNTLQDQISPVFKAIYNSIHNILYSQTAYLIVGLIVCFWLISLLKQGFPSRQDIFKAGKWILVVVFIYGIFYSYGAYSEFITWFMIPAQWVKEGVSSTFQSSSNNFGNILTNAMNTLWKFDLSLKKTAIAKKDSYITPDIFIYIWLYLGSYGFYVFTFLINIFGTACIIIVSIFLALLILSTAPIMIPFLILKKTHSYFFSWLKLFVSYSLYAPIALLIIQLSLSTIKTLEKIGTPQMLEKVYDNQVTYFFPGIIINLICIYLLIKIPNWVSQIVGVQGLDGGGGAAAMIATQGMSKVAGAALGGGIAEKSGGGSFMLGALKGAGKQIPGAQTATQGAKMLAGGAMNLLSKTVGNGKGAVASP